MQHNTQSGITGAQEPSGPGHRKQSTTHRAGTPVNGSQVAQDTAQAMQRSKRKFYSDFNTVFVPLLLLAAGVGFLAACF